MIRRVEPAEVRPLRHAVLRPGQSFEETEYAGDDHPDTVHFGAFAGDRLVGVASLYREDRADGAAGPGWRVRGMATEPGVRGQGYGRELLGACVDHVAGSGGGELWCNARRPAVAFYGAAGFDVVGEEFDIPGIGPHFVMRRVVGSAP